MSIKDINDLFCSVEGCESIVKAKGLCTKHHQRWYRTGSTSLVKKKWPRKCKTEECQNNGHSYSFGYCWKCYQTYKGGK